MGEHWSDIPVLKPGQQIAMPGEPQPEADEATKKLYADALPKTVQIVTDHGVGSGFFMDRDGKIGTAAHVVLGSREHFAVTADGTKYKLEFEKLDDINDTAIMKPLGFKKGSRPFVEIDDSKGLKADDPLYPMGHPQGLRPAYISPGYFRNALTQMGLITSVEKDAEPEVNAAVEGLTPKEQVLMKQALARDILNGKVHIRPGDSGGPVFNKDGKLVGMNDMITSFENGYFVPSEKIQALYNNKDSDFKFSYGRIAEPWVQDYKNTWNQKPILALSETVGAGGLAYVGYQAMSKMPRTLGLAASAYSGIRLVEDAGNLLDSTDTRDKLKYSLASVSDLSSAVGGLAFMSSRFRMSGTIGLLAGIGGRIAADFIPSRLVLKDITRKSDSLMPPLDPQIDKTLGL